MCHIIRILLQLAFYFGRYYVCDISFLGGAAGMDAASYFTKRSFPCLLVLFTAPLSGSLP